MARIQLPIKPTPWEKSYPQPALVTWTITCRDAGKKKKIMFNRPHSNSVHRRVSIPLGTTCLLDCSSFRNRRFLLCHHRATATISTTTTATATATAINHQPRQQPSARVAAEKSSWPLTPRTGAKKKESEMITTYYTPSHHHHHHHHHHHLPPTTTTCSQLWY